MSWCPAFFAPLPHTILYLLYTFALLSSFPFHSPYVLSSSAAHKTLASFDVLYIYTVSATFASWARVTAVWCESFFVLLAAVNADRRKSYASSEQRRLGSFTSRSSPPRPPILPVISCYDPPPHRLSLTSSTLERGHETRRVREQCDDLNAGGSSFAIADGLEFSQSMRLIRNIWAGL